MTFSPLSAVILQGAPHGASSLPHPALAGHVSSFWDLRFEQGAHTVRSLPDGCADLVFDLAAAPPIARVTGPQLEPRTFQLQGRVALFGVRLLPGAAPRLLGRQVGSGDLWVPLDHWLGAAAGTLTAAVADAPGLADRIEVLESWLAERLLAAEDARLARAITLVFEGAGDVRVADLARRAGLSERALSRSFGERLGLSPKRFCRVVRFQHALRRVAGRPAWAALAAELGYADQAHMIREFKALFGCTPEDAVALMDGAR